MKTYKDYITEASLQKDDSFTFSNIGGSLSPLNISLPTQRNPEMEGGLELNFASGTPVKYNLVIDSDLEIHLKTLNGSLEPTDDQKKTAETNIEKIINQKNVKLKNDILAVLQRFDADIEKVLKDNGFTKI